MAYAADEGLSANEFVLWHALLNFFNQRAKGNDWPDGFVTVSNNRLLALTTFNGRKRDETLRLTRKSLVERGLIEYVEGQRNSSNPQYRLIYFTSKAAPMPAYDAPQPPAEQDEPQDGEPDMHGNVDNHVDNIVDNCNEMTITPNVAPHVAPNLAPNVAPFERGKTGGNIGDIYKDYDNDLDYDEDIDGSPPYSVLSPEDKHTQIFNAAAEVTRTHARGNMVFLPNAQQPGIKQRKPWYDPSDPDADCDESFAESPKARAAIAQRIIDHYPKWELKRDYDNIHGLLCDAMRAGMHPAILQECAERAKKRGESCKGWAGQILMEAHKQRDWWKGITLYDYQDNYKKIHTLYTNPEAARFVLRMQEMLTRAEGG